MNTENTFPIEEFPTLIRIKEHAAILMERGSPFTEEEVEIIKLATPAGAAWNAGKRKVKKTTGSGK